MSAIGDAKNAVVTVSSGSATTVQPPAGEEWIIRDVASVLYLNGFPAGFNSGLYDGSNFSIVRPDHSFIWGRKLVLFVTNSVYLRFADTDATADTIAYSAIVTNISGTTAGRADAKVAVSSVAASGFMTIQPPAGQTWSLTEIGSDQLLNAGTGNAAPDTQTTMYDGSNSIIVQNTNTNSYTRPWNAFLTNSVYGRIQNLSASTAILAYSAVRIS